MIRHPEFAVRSVPGGDLDQREQIEITLDRGAQIEGHVVRRGGGSIAGGVRVFAWPSHQTLVDPRDVVLASQGSPVVPFADADTNGEFRVTGLREGVGYSLIAAGSGLFSGWEYQDIETGRSGIEVECAPLFAIQYSFASKAGEFEVPGEWAKRWQSARYLSMVPDPGVDAQLVDDVVAKLAGLEVAFEFEDAHFILLQSSVDVERVGPLVLNVDLPGYRPEQFDLYANPLELGIQPEVLFLEQQAQSFGSFDLRAEQLPLGFELADPMLIAGVLRLSKGEAPPIRIALTVDEVREGCRLSGVPTGDYAVTFVGSLGLLQIPRPGGVPLAVEVTSSSVPSALTVDFSSSACLSLQLLDEEGWPVVGRAGFLPMAVEANGETPSARGTLVSRNVAHDRLPVLLVAPGHYRVEPLRPVVGLQPVADPDGRGKLSPPVVVRLGGGESHTVIWQTL